MKANSKTGLVVGGSLFLVIIVALFIAFVRFENVEGKSKHEIERLIRPGMSPEGVVAGFGEPAARTELQWHYKNWSRLSISDPMNYPKHFGVFWEDEKVKQILYSAD